MANDATVPMTPAAALARHVEWLEFALAAAKDEEARRRGRLERASDKNREKRTRRLAEVSAEVRELDALVQGIRDLELRAARKATSVPKAPRSRRAATPEAQPAPSTTRRGRRHAAAPDEPA